MIPDVNQLVKKQNLSQALNIIVQSIDSRVRILEENQSKIANSLSRFLVKMNQVFFKGSDSI